MQQRIYQHRLIVFYALAFAISWTSWGAMAWLYRGGELGATIYALSTLGGLGPLFALLLLQKLSGKQFDAQALISRIHFRNIRPVWLVPAIITVPIAVLLGNLGYWLLGWEGNFRLIKAGPDEMGLAILPVMVIQFVAGLATSPLFEEPGWRGFALTEFQQRYPPFVSSLLVGVLWWLWHQPMNLTFGLQPTVYTFLWMVTFSFMIDAVYTLSGNNIFAAMLAHQSYGTANSFLYLIQPNWIQLGILVVCVVALRLSVRTSGVQGNTKTPHS